MAVLPIITAPDPRLTRPSIAVAEVTNAIRDLARDLIDTMASVNAAGISAIQVGRCERMFVIDGKLATGQATCAAVVFINPLIISVGGQVVSMEEGCLSFPEVFQRVLRPGSVCVRATNLEGETFETSAQGLYACALQHEYDHLVA